MQRTERHICFCLSLIWPRSPGPGDLGGARRVKQHLSTYQPLGSTRSSCPGCRRYPDGRKAVIMINQ